ncbi:MAG: hypothetical protein JNL47_09265 [Bacteroidia bacterium]|nr:hypothetical protein [Bacteroidia bacterium]
MQHITGTGRQQLSFQSPEQQISHDNPVRVMDAFVEKLDLKKPGFG